MKSDPDYRENQARAQEKWLKKNPGYWQRYRELNPEYADRNRLMQRSRNLRTHQASFAKIDVSEPGGMIRSGVYRMVGISMDGIAKSDAWMVSITVLPAFDKIS